MAPDNELGQHIARLRLERKLSREDLAKKCNCSVDIIASLEEGKLSPSLAPLLQIARALGVHLGNLLDDNPRFEPVIIRKDDFSAPVVRFSGIRVAGDASTLEFHPLARNKAGRHMEPFLINVHPTVSEDCMFSIHEGEEFIYVLEGRIQVSYGSDRYILEPGDSIYYDSTTPHEVRACGEASAKILAVVYTPE
ncbi:MAG: XRE family transcriptional regulator [Candidatus Hydrogenedentes bacterium]|nr:XRE family transcriptional regulator [Candidatus Hydrogenedentota bacterium]